MSDKYDRQETIGNLHYAIEQAQSLAKSYNQSYVVLRDGRVVPKHVFDLMKVKPKILEVVHPTSS